MASPVPPEGEAGLSPELLDMLVCPETHQPLRLAEAGLLAQVNEAIAAHRLVNKAGEAVAQPLDAGLLREDGQTMFPVRGGIPELLSDEAIPLDQLG